jgi:hypothetical protein
MSPYCRWCREVCYLVIRRSKHRSLEYVSGLAKHWWCLQIFDSRGIQPKLCDSQSTLTLASLSESLRPG